MVTQKTATMRCQMLKEGSTMVQGDARALSALNVNERLVSTRLIACTNGSLTSCSTAWFCSRGSVVSTQRCVTLNLLQMAALVFHVSVASRPGRRM